MIALGIDPGTRRVGYGVVKSERGKLTLIDAGILAIESQKKGTVTDDGAALMTTRTGTAQLIKKYKPEVVGVERLFFAKNQRTAMAVAQARGAVLLAIKEADIPVREYGPNEVKLGITGYGLADKKAVLKMVRFMLNEHELEVIDDASDALALAIMACGQY